MTAIVEEVTKKPIPAHQRHLVFEICCDDPTRAEDAEGDVEVPYVLYRLK